MNKSENKSEWLMIIIISVLLLIGLLLWLCFDKTKEFGLNFFTEMIGSVVAIFIIDKLIKNREETKSIPQKLAAYEDVRLYTSRYIGFWIDAFRESVPEDDPETIEVFFSENGMSKILKYLYLDSQANVFPSRNWHNWIIDNAKKFQENGNKILDRYSYNLDPEAFGYLHQLAGSLFNECLLTLPSIYQFDTLEKIPRVRILASYSISPDKDFEAILGLIKWCNESYNQLIKYDSSIIKVSEYAPKKDKRMPPKCMIPVSILLTQNKEFLQFIKKSDR